MPSSIFQFDPDGPTIQQGHVVRTPHLGGAVSEEAPGDRPDFKNGQSPGPPDKPDPIATQSAQFFRIHSSTNASLDGTESIQVPKDQPSTPDAGWLPPGVKEEDIYKIKHLKSITITKV